MHFENGDPSARRSRNTLQIHIRQSASQMITDRSDHNPIA